MNRLTFRWPVRLACFAAIVLAAGAAVTRAPQPAAAAPPSALALAEHGLSLPSMLADESPYELIDPIGPGGISLEQAKNEVAASTMIGGIYADGTHTMGGY